MPLNEYSYINRPEEEPVQVPERTSLADIPRNRTLLELATGIETAEDIGPISENWLVRDWILPGITGASAETEEYKPGLLDMALAYPGLHIVGKAGKKAYSSVRNLLRDRNTLLRAADNIDDLPGIDWDDLNDFATRMSQDERESLISRGWGEVSPSGQTVETIAEAAPVEDIPTPLASAVAESTGEVAEEVAEGVPRIFQDLPSNVPVIEGADAAGAYKMFKFDLGQPDQVLKIERADRNFLMTTHNIGDTYSRVELRMASVRDPSIKEWMQSNSGATLNFLMKKVEDESGRVVTEISNISFFSSGEYGQRYAGRLIGDLIRKMPKNTIINEGSMTFDSFYMMLNQAIKQKRNIIFDMARTQEIKPSHRSVWSKKWNEAVEKGDDALLKETIDDIMRDARRMINKYAINHPEKVRGTLNPEAILEWDDVPSGHFNIQNIKISNITSILAGVLGFKNREQFEKVLTRDEESVEAQIFDNDFSL
jgi:hypothetical protein